MTGLNPSPVMSTSTSLSLEAWAGVMAVSRGADGGHPDRGGEAATGVELVAEAEGHGDEGGRGAAGERARAVGDRLAGACIGGRQAKAEVGAAQAERKPGVRPESGPGEIAEAM